jgi:hypothetical protein
MKSILRESPLPTRSYAHGIGAAKTAEAGKLVAVRR